MLSNNINTSSEFLKQYRGAFTGILRWPQLDDLWSVLSSRAGAGWYVYAIGEPVPTEPVSEQELNRFITEIDKLLREEHDEDYCGIVYVDDKQEPKFIKIYDPNNLGVVCGFSDDPPLPGWTITLTRPETLDKKVFLTQSRRRWWNRLFRST